MRKTRKNSADRAWEIDFVRGTAVLLMAAFHTVFNLATYYGYDINYMSGSWYIVGRFSAMLFMFVSGVSSTFSKSLLKRGITVLECALVVTLVSIPIMRENYIRFGILHFFGTIMIIKHFADKIVKSDSGKLLVAKVMIPVSLLLGEVFYRITAPSELFLPFGMMTVNFQSYDYYPLFPWGAFFWGGVLAGEMLYKKTNKKSLFLYNPHKTGSVAISIQSGLQASPKTHWSIAIAARFQLISKRNAYIINRAINAICYLGERSLVVYMLHQPAIVAILYAAHRLNIL